MPINCPIPYGSGRSCLECPYRRGSTCAVHQIPVPLKEIMTPDERIDLLEEEMARIRTIVPSYVLASLRQDLEQVKGELRHFAGIFNEAMEKQKKKRIKRKGPRGTGAVEV